MSTDLRWLLPELIPSGCNSPQPGCPGGLQDEIWGGHASHPCAPQHQLGMIQVDLALGVTQVGL